VTEISRSDAGGAELERTTRTIGRLIADARAKAYKAICFVTGVPGAGKTLIGLNVATKHFDKENDLYSVFQSGNGPLVKILQEALARDKVAREQAAGRTMKKGEARSEVKMFIQNVHHYRDECLRDPQPPIDHVALFDEAQRAWDLEQTSKFMRTKKGQAEFHQSEPEFLLSCIDRHPDWGVVVCVWSAVAKRSTRVKQALVNGLLRLIALFQVGISISQTACTMPNLEREKC
jgi:hypothetical protein